MTVALLAATTAFSVGISRAAEVMPPKPAGYFNDYAGTVPKEAALRLNEQLAQFERETSNQILVAVYPKMETDSDIFDYTYRIKDKWGVGQTDRNNGAVLFVYVQDRKMFLQVGYGLEGVLPDATAKDITENVIKPRFKAGDYPGGLSAGVDAMLRACKGEYQGSGKTMLEATNNTTLDNRWFTFFIFLFVLAMMSRLFRKRRGYGYSGRGGTYVGGWGGGGGGWSSGSSSGGGFSGFSGGGGSGGGGGAGSSW